MIEINLLAGKDVKLKPLTENDLSVMTQWYHDPGSLRQLDALPAFPRTQEALAEWVKNSQKPQRDYLFGIFLQENERLIGYIELDGILWNHGSCGASYLIGEQAQRGKGYAAEALQLALKFAFHELNLYRITLTIFSYNKVSIALAEKLGFVREGAFREHISRDGQRYDMLLYGLLRPEWEKNHNHA